jgi:putative effector of murein hydrolase LrgA (UPF0299 family)
MTLRDGLFLALAFLLLVACNMAGDFVAALLHLPVPGTVIGILILLGLLMIYGRVPEPLRSMAVYLLGHLNLLYVPAGVGVLAYVSLVRSDLWPIVAVLFLSTFISMIASALAFHWTAKLTAKEDDEA